MSKPDTWMPFFVGDYLADTSHLARDEHGGYLLLLFAAWPRGGKLPDDDDQLARIARASRREWVTLRKVLAPFFYIADGAWIQKRLLREFEAANERREQAAEKARLAAEKRWAGHQKQDAPSNAPSMNGASHPAAEKDAPSNAPSIPAPMLGAMLEECPPPPPPPSTSKTPPALEEGGGEGFSLAQPAPKAKRAAARTVKPREANLGTRLPDDWRIPEEWIAWTLKAYPSLDRQRVVRLSVEFRDYWIAVPGKAGRKAHWLATWRNRVSKVMERG